MNVKCIEIIYVGNSSSYVAVRKRKMFGTINVAQYDIYYERYMSKS